MKKVCFRQQVTPHVIRKTKSDDECKFFMIRLLVQLVLGFKCKKELKLSNNNISSSIPQSKAHRLFAYALTIVISEHKSSLVLGTVLFFLQDYQANYLPHILKCLCSFLQAFVFLVPSPMLPEHVELLTNAFKQVLRIPFPPNKLQLFPF